MKSSADPRDRVDDIAAKEPGEQAYLRALLDAPFVFKQEWKQTSIDGPPPIEDVVQVCMPREYTTNSSQEVLRTRLGKVLIAHCRGIRLDPYNPKMWIDRGRHFMELGYGELAVSDAYKGRLLLDSFLGVFDTKNVYWDLDKDSLPCKVSAALAGTIGKLDTGVTRQCEAGNVSIAKSLQQQAFLVMASALLCVRAYHDAIQVLDEAVVLGGTSEGLQKLCSQVKERSRSMEQPIPARHQKPGYMQRSTKQGGVQRVAYPWINPEELGRGNKAMKKAKTKLEAASRNATLGPSSLGGATSDNLGVFARQDITRNELIVTDRSAFTVFNVQGKDDCWACSKPLGHEIVFMNCCNNKFCSESCKTEAVNTYHRVLCDKDFEWLYRASKDADQSSNDMVPLMLMKILATAVQQNAKPLKGTSFQNSNFTFPLGALAMRGIRSARTPRAELKA